MFVCSIQESDAMKLEQKLNAGQIEEVILQVSAYCSYCASLAKHHSVISNKKFTSVNLHCMIDRQMVYFCTFYTFILFTNIKHYSYKDNQQEEEVKN